MKNSICALFGFLGSALTYLIGGWDEAVITLLIFMVIDLIVGVINAAFFSSSKKTKSGKLSSAEMSKGLVKKCTILLFIVIANRLDVQLGLTYVKDGVCIAFMTSELISIVENAGLMGLPIPAVITNMIEVLKGNDDHEFSSKNNSSGN